MEDSSVRYIHKVTGKVDTREGWLAAYDVHELEARGISAEAAFDEDEGYVLFRIRWAHALSGKH